MEDIETIKSGQHIGKITLGEMESLIQEAYKEGWESDDLLARCIGICW